ncbi:class F sortase [Mangrovihabitans endophyticus]|uniref:Class F sortase n=1 Tax=Mangrovihabitans endophyticus TaxID=1751298 RepID=A0A8J3C305_9ACTN|nr:class F sortase [Mangrovihabitans endophyticus]GGL10051.1 class F sortase [Mangrovihabitans endophyticus]
MNSADTPSTAGHRRGRLTLLAVAVALVLLGAAALIRAAADHRDEPPLSTAAGNPAPPSAVASTPAGRDDLTTGPQMPSSPPQTLVIPALHVDVPLIGLGRQSDGSMQVPDDATTVGWYTGAPTPGSLGPAVLAGHVDFNHRAGTFAHLGDLDGGDRITVTRADRSTAVFAVTHVRRYPKDQFPSDAVYGPIDHAGLRLITCGGDFNDSSGHYDDNIVVFAVLKQAEKG